MLLNIRIFKDNGVLIILEVRNIFAFFHTNRKWTCSYKILGILVVASFAFNKVSLLWFCAFRGGQKCGDLVANPEYSKKKK